MNSAEPPPILDERPDETGGAMDWSALYHAVRERLWIVILCAVLAAIGSAVYMAAQPRAYQARSVLFIEQTPARVLDKVQGVREEQIVSLDMINTTVDLLHSFPFAQRVAARLKLHKDPRFLQSMGEKPAGPVTVDDAASMIVGRVNPSYRQRTRLIDIFVIHPDSSLAVALADAYADEYIRYGFDQRAEANKSANGYLLDEAERLRKQLRTSEEAMQSFREREKAASLEGMQAESQNKLNDLSRSITEVENRISQIDNDLKIASEKPGDADTLLRLPSVATQGKVVEITQVIADQERQFTLIKQRYRAKHPQYIALQTQLSSLYRDRDNVLKSVVDLLRGERQRLQAQDDELKKTNSGQQDRMLTVTSKSIEYNDLRRAVETNTALYNAVVGRVAEIDVTKGMTDSQVRVQEHAMGAASLRPNLAKVYGIGIGLGLVTGLGITILLHFLDSSVKSVDQAERLSGLPVLTAIPKRPGGNPRLLDSVAVRDGMVAEAFRSLRTSLAMTTNADTRRLFLFTSAVPGEGKTFCSSNFAVTLAHQGFRTLLIDADLRKPAVSQVFFGKNTQPGLAEILISRATLSEAAQSTEIDNLAVVTAGGRAPNPAELLAAPQMRELLEHALTVYDRVVIDSAPVLAVSDALLIAPYVDVTCLVLRAFKTPRTTLTRALKALEEIHRQPVGIIFNFLPTGAGSYYYYSGKQQGFYGEKGVYGT